MATESVQKKRFKKIKIVHLAAIPSTLCKRMCYPRPIYKNWHVLPQIGGMQVVEVFKKLYSTRQFLYYFTVHKYGNGYTNLIFHNASFRANCTWARFNSNFCKAKHEKMNFVYINLKRVYKCQTWHFIYSCRSPAHWN